MIPPELFKPRRRHNNTPEPILLIIANFIVVFAGLTLFAVKGRVHWFFWVCMGLLALYNFFNLRRNRELYNRTNIIAYIISLFVLVLVFFLFKGKA